MRPTNNMEVIVGGAVSLPLSNIKKSTMIFGGSDDDTDVCLNCTLPPNRCKGGNKCYLKHKKIKDGGESDERQRSET